MLEDLRRRRMFSYEVELKMGDDLIDDLKATNVVSLNNR